MENKETSIIEDVEGPRKISRRTFLKGALATTALTALGVSLRESSGKRKEQLQQLPPNIIMIDFAPETRIEGVKQEEYPNNQEVMKEMLAGEYRSEAQLIKEFGLETLNKEALEKKVFSKYPKLALAYGFMKTFANHGREVASAMRLILNKYGFRNEPHVVPIQPMLGQYEFIRDELENFGLFGEVDLEKIIEALENHPDQKVVNFSFQVGRVGFVYRERSREVKPGQKSTTVVRVKAKGGETSTSIIKNGKLVPVTEKELEEIEEAEFVIVEHEPFLDIEGAYTRKMAKENLPKLFKICQTFPERLFVVAAGNYNDDFLEERVTFQDQWPVNLLMVAEWGQEGPIDNVEGADIYVKNRALGLEHGSSFSTPTITAVASILENQGLKPAQIKAKILSLCQPGIYKGYEPKVKAFVSRQACIFDPDVFG